MKVGQRSGWSVVGGGEDVKAAGSASAPAKSALVT